ncbi:hypothetical protein M9458_019286, partial [Cirrhinus mrigala]
PENLLVDLHVPVPCVKLSDLGDAVQVSGHRYVHLLLGNPEFAAPELIQGTPVSLGAGLRHAHLEETCVNICRLDFCFPEEYFSGVSQAAKDFIVSTLNHDPRKRPSSATAHSGDYSKTPLDTTDANSYTMSDLSQTLKDWSAAVWDTPYETRTWAGGKRF